MSLSGTRRLLEPERLSVHLERLYRAAWGLCGSAHDAEDLVQETYARVLARPRLLRAGDELPYLHRVLRNTYLTGLRTAGRRPRTVELPVDESETLRSKLAEPDVALEQRELLAGIAATPGRAAGGARGSRRPRALLPRGGKRAQHARDDDHHAALPSAAAHRELGGEPAGRWSCTPSSDEPLHPRRRVNRQAGSQAPCSP